MTASNSLCTSPKHVASGVPGRAIEDVNHCRVGERVVWSARWHKQMNLFSATGRPRDSRSCLWHSVRGCQAFAYRHTCPHAMGSFAAVLRKGRLYLNQEPGSKTMAPCLLSQSYFQIIFSTFYKQATFWLPLLQAQLQIYKVG